MVEAKPTLVLSGMPAQTEVTTIPSRHAGPPPLILRPLSCAQSSIQSQSQSLPIPEKVATFWPHQRRHIRLELPSEQEDKERAAEFNLHFTASYKYLSGSRWFGE